MKSFGIFKLNLIPFRKGNQVLLLSFSPRFLMLCSKAFNSGGSSYRFPVVETFFLNLDYKKVYNKFLEGVSKWII